MCAASRIYFKILLLAILICVGTGFLPQQKLEKSNVQIAEKENNLSELNSQNEKVITVNDDILEATSDSYHQRTKESIAFVQKSSRTGSFHNDEIGKSTIEGNENLVGQSSTLAFGFGLLNSADNGYLKS